MHMSPLWAEKSSFDIFFYNNFITAPLSDTLSPIIFWQEYRFMVSPRRAILQMPVESLVGELCSYFIKIKENQGKVLEKREI